MDNVTKINLELDGGCDGYYHLIESSGKFYYFTEFEYSKGVLTLFEYNSENSFKFEIQNLNELSKLDEFKDAKALFNLGYHRCDYEPSDDICENLDYIKKQNFIRLDEVDCDLKMLI